MSTSKSSRFTVHGSRFTIAGPPHARHAPSTVNRALPTVNCSFNDADNGRILNISSPVPERPAMTVPLRDRIYRTDAVVLSRLDFGEADRILTVYTPRHGKVRVIAKGARKPASRLLPHLEYFTRSRLYLAKIGRAHV